MFSSRRERIHESVSQTLLNPLKSTPKLTPCELERSRAQYTHFIPRPVALAITPRCVMLLAVQLNSNTLTHKAHSCLWKIEGAPSSAENVVVAFGRQGRRREPKVLILAPSPPEITEG